MDFSKYPLQKVLHILAAVIPGFVALWIHDVAAPGSFGWLWSSNLLGYRTKLSVALLAMLLVGTTINTLVNMVLGAVGGVLGGANGRHAAPDTAPWRDLTWRGALSKVLLDAAPANTAFWFARLAELKKEQVNLLTSEPQKTLALAKLESERLQNLREDMEWERWYRHYHFVLLNPSESDIVFYVQRGLQFNLETASLYALVSLLFVPGIRHWWLVAPATFWAFGLITYEIYGVHKALNMWSTLDRQITYLTERACGSSKTGADAQR